MESWSCTHGASPGPREQGKPNLEAELKPLQKTEERLSQERRNILDAIAKNGAESRGLFEKLGEVETRLDQVTRRIEEVRAELGALDGQVIDEQDLRQALAPMPTINFAP